jgi:signal peptidase I
VSGLGVVVALAGAVSFLTGFHPFSVGSTSMAPTLKPGQTLIAEYSPAAVRPGDIVLVDAPSWTAAGPVVKRVIGVGGDRIVCCTAGRLVRDGRVLDEPYATANGNAVTGRFSVAVPAGRIFLLGDNRDDSIDSRMFVTDSYQGSLPLSAVRGRVVWVSGRGSLPGASSSFGRDLLLTGLGALLFVLGVIGLVVALLTASRQRNRAAGLTGP